MIRYRIESDNNDDIKISIPMDRPLGDTGHNVETWVVIGVAWRQIGQIPTAFNVYNVFAGGGPTHSNVNELQAVRELVGIAYDKALAT